MEIGAYDLGSDVFSYYMNAIGTPGAYFFLLSGYEGGERLFEPVENKENRTA